MSYCFICKVLSNSGRSSVFKSVAPYSKTSYPQIIAGLLGEEFVVIVTPDDQLCKKCTLLINHMDKCKNDVKLIKDTMAMNIFKKYGVLPPGKSIKRAEVINGYLKTEEQKKRGLRKVPNSLPIRVAHTVTTNSVISPIPTPLKLSKTLQQPQQLLCHQQNQPQQQEINKKVKIYKCGFCTYYSKDITHARFHMQNHVKIPAQKHSVEKPIGNQAAATTLTPVPQRKKRFYICQACSLTFDSQINCLDHIQKDHNPPTPSTSNGARETEDSRPVTTQGVTPEPFNTDINENQQYKDGGTVDTDKMLNDNVPTEEFKDVKEEKKSENGSDEEETENSQEGANLGNEPKPIKEEEAESGGEEDAKDTAVPEQADSETFDGNVVKIEDDE